MAKATSVLQTLSFKKAVKKLKPNQKKDLDAAIKELMAEPTLGGQKKGGKRRTNHTLAIVIGYDLAII